MFQRKKQFFTKVGDFGCLFAKDFVNIFDFIGELWISLYRACKKPHRIRWRETFYYMDKCGSDAVPIISVVGLLVGLVLGLQGAVVLAMFGAGTMVMKLVVIAVMKELGPLMVAIVATGRAGSSFAAEIGTMQVTEEIDALITMGLSPFRFLVIPKVLAMLVVLPILTMIGNIAGIIGGISIAYLKVGLTIPEAFYDSINLVNISNISESLVKSLVFSIIIASVGCLRGFEAEGDAQSVGRTTTSAVVSSIFLLAIADTILSTLFTL